MYKAIKISNWSDKVTSIEASIMDMELRYKLEDDPKKQSMIFDELQHLGNERDEAKKDHYKYYWCMLLIGRMFFISYYIFSFR